MRIGKKEFNVETPFAGPTYVMGIMNVTPDSFSDGGRYNLISNALKRAEEMISQGVDIIDIGGESTRPGYTRITDEEEIERVCPFIEQIKANFDIPISLDTYKSEVAKAGIGAGVDLINDVWGLRADGRMGEVIASSDIPCVLMHNRESLCSSNHLMEDMAEDFAETIKIANQAGIKREKIILDPGIGFAKDTAQNLEVLRKLKEFHSFGYPLLLGCSRKSVIGNTLNLPVDERMEGTLVTTVQAVFAGYSFVRVHDVLENVRTVKMAMAIREDGGHER